MNNNRNHVLASEFEVWRNQIKISAMEFFAIRYVEDVLPTKEEIKYLEKHFEGNDEEDYKIIMLIKQQMEERGLM